jgi:hypothetical protein
MKQNNDKYYAKKNQVSYGEAIGILLLDCQVPFIPGDVANATTYDFPVRFKKVDGFTTERALEKDPTIFSSLLESALELQRNGVRAITGDCGYMALHQSKLREHLNIPVFLSSLLQIHFIRQIIMKDALIGILCTDSTNLDKNLLSSIDINHTDDLVIFGLQDSKAFSDAVIKEAGVLYAEKVENEVCRMAERLIAEHPDVRAILLECSCLPPYGAAVQKATNLPVFDYYTMIVYVYNAVVKKKFKGFM